MHPPGDKVLMFCIPGVQYSCCYCILALEKELNFGHIHFRMGLLSTIHTLLHICATFELCIHV